MAERFSLKDHLFNADSLSDLATEFGNGLPSFDTDAFHAKTMSGLAERELMARLDWIADCIQEQLASDFPTMAKQLISCMPAPLDHTKTDDDFGRFIHAVPGILAVRHGLQDHRDIALDLIYEATKRFSMEFYIRPFLNTWPEQTMERLAIWVRDPNYHVRRLVSEGTRHRLPWAGKITIDVEQPLPLLDQLQGDPTRYVTRSIANHLNDVAKVRPDLVIERLQAWRETGSQKPKELDWMTRHALRTLIKQGHKGAMELLGYRSNADVTLHNLTLSSQVKRGGVQDFSFDLHSNTKEPVIVDYVLHAVKSDGTLAPKVYKLKQAVLQPGNPLAFRKAHKFKDDATTFTLHPGLHRIDIQVNGNILGGQDFDLL